MQKINANVEKMTFLWHRNEKKYKLKIEAAEKGRVREAFCANFMIR